ncbi:MAG: hypothetical protein IPP08_09275 [Chlorobiota bacterium]|nr:hypothetical protein [Chlorobiota bacterium]QQS65955.1 MAG: hypothetical protein IPP08_09275 [Chlorobiota bacterium]
MTSLLTLINDSISTLLNGNIYYIAHTNITNFGLNPRITMSGDTNTVITASYFSASSDPLNIFSISLIKGLKHAYPIGTNHPYKAAEENWKWLKQYILP